MAEGSPSGGNTEVVRNVLLNFSSKGVGAVTSGAKAADATIKKLKSSVEGVTNSFERFAGIVAGGLAIDKTTDTFINLNKSLILGTAQFTKYGASLTSVRKTMESLSRETSLTRQSTLELMKLYERGVPLASLQGAEKLLKNIVQVTGANTEAIREYQSALTQLASTFPTLQKSLEDMTAADQKRIRALTESMVASGEMSLAQARAVREIADGQKFMTDREKSLLNIEQERVKSAEELKRQFEDFSMTVGKTLMPLMQGISDALKENKFFIKDIITFTVKWGAILTPIVAGLGAAAVAIGTIKKGAAALAAIKGGGLNARTGGYRGGGMMSALGGRGSSPTKPLYVVDIMGFGGGRGARGMRGNTRAARTRGGMMAGSARARGGAGGLMGGRRASFGRRIGAGLGLSGRQMRGGFGGVARGLGGGLAKGLAGGIGIMGLGLAGSALQMGGNTVQDNSREMKTDALRRGESVKKGAAVGLGGSAMKVGGSALVGAGTGAALGSFIPVLGTAVGGAIGGAIGGLVGIWQDRENILGNIEALITGTNEALEEQKRIMEEMKEEEKAADDVKRLEGEQRINERQAQRQSLNQFMAGEGGSAYTDEAVKAAEEIRAGRAELSDYTDNASTILTASERRLIDRQATSGRREYASEEQDRRSEEQDRIRQMSDADFVNFYNSQVGEDQRITGTDEDDIADARETVLTGLGEEMSMEDAEEALRTQLAQEAIAENINAAGEERLAQLDMMNKLLEKQSSILSSLQSQFDTQLTLDLEYGGLNPSEVRDNVNNLMSDIEDQIGRREIEVGVQRDRATEIEDSVRRNIQEEQPELEGEAFEQEVQATLQNTQEYLQALNSAEKAQADMLQLQMQRAQLLTIESQKLQALVSAYETYASSVGNVLDSTVELASAYGSIADMGSIQAAAQDKIAANEQTMAQFSNERASILSDIERLRQDESDQGTRIRELQARLVQLSAEENNIRVENLQLLKQQVEFAQRLASAQSALADSQSNLLTTQIEFASITGDINPQALAKSFGEVTSELDNQRDALQIVLQEQEAVLEAQRAAGADENSETVLQTKKEINDVTSELLSIERKRQDALTAITQAYQLQRSLTAQDYEYASGMVDLMDNLAVGIGASAQMRLDAVSAAEQELNVIREQRDALEQTMASGQMTSEGRLKVQEQLNSLRNEELSIVQKQNQQVRALRDGWISTLTASTNAQGRITKIMVTQEGNLAAMSDYFGGVRSSVSGASLRAGEMDIGARESQRFTQSGGGPAGTAGIGGGTGVGYRTDQDVAYGWDSFEMSQQLLRGQRESTVRQFGDRMSEAARRSGSGLGVTGGNQQLLNVPGQQQRMPGGSGGEQQENSTSELGAAGVDTTTGTAGAAGVDTTTGTAGDAGAGGAAGVGGEDSDQETLIGHVADIKEILRQCCGLVARDQSNRTSREQTTGNLSGEGTESEGIDAAIGTNVARASGPGAGTNTTEYRNELEREQDALIRQNQMVASLEEGNDLTQAITGDGSGTLKYSEEEIDAAVRRHNQRDGVETPEPVDIENAMQPFKNMLQGMSSSGGLVGTLASKALNMVGGGEKEEAREVEDTTAEIINPMYGAFRARGAEDSSDEDPLLSRGINENNPLYVQEVNAAQLNVGAAGTPSIDNRDPQGNSAASRSDMRRRRTANGVTINCTFHVNSVREGLNQLNHRLRTLEGQYEDLNGIVR